MPKPLLVVLLLFCASVPQAFSMAEAPPAPPLEDQPRTKLLAKGLEMYGAPRELAIPIAASVLRQAPERGVDPALIVAIITVENPTLVPKATSSVGARGVMQVMPLWTRSRLRDTCGSDLTDNDVNICYGIRILQIHVEQAGGSLRRGLLHYNGCKTDTLCVHYPDIVRKRYRQIQIISRGDR